MNPIDKQIRSLARKERLTLPPETEECIRRALRRLPSTPGSSDEAEEPGPFPAARKLSSSRRKPRLPRPAAAAAAVLALFFLLPNISASAAETMSELPVIGAIVEVITIRNYFYDDGYHRSSVDVPQVELETESENSSLGDSVDAINADVQAMTDRLIAEFEADRAALGDSGHTELSVSYQVVTNNDAWFTLQILVYYGSGSGTQTYYYYHIDKQSGQIVQLSDLFLEGSDYQTVISDEILRQMKEQMAKDDNITYWIDTEYEGMDFHSITPDQNFFFSDDGNLVIQFDEYEIAPGSMGSPQFEISRSVYQDLLKEGY